MNAVADGIGLLGEIVEVAVDNDFFQRAHDGGPFFSIGIIPCMQFCGQFEEPCPAIGALKRAGVLAAEEGDLACHGLGGELSAQCGAHGRSLRQVGP